MSTRPVRIQFFEAIALALFLVISGANAAPDESTAGGPKTPDAQTQEAVRAYQQMQEQLRGMQSAIDRNQQDSQDIAARNVKALGERLNSIEQAVGTQRAAELQALQSTNHFMLVITTALVLLGIVIVFFAYMQWRAMHQLTEAALGFQVQQQLAGARSPAFIEAGEPRLMSMVERLEKRIRELEAGNHLPLSSGTMHPAVTGAGENGAHQAATGASQAVLLINKGQSLLSLGQYDKAVETFDEALALEPHNTEALIKKGTALEKQEKLDEAVVCYDRAIAADQTVTLAYLYKGGVFNRMERYNEALECYEKALKTQEKSHAA